MGESIGVSVPDGRDLIGHGWDLMMQGLIGRDVTGCGQMGWMGRIWGTNKSHVTNLSASRPMHPIGPGIIKSHQVTSPSHPSSSTSHLPTPHSSRVPASGRGAGNGIPIGTQRRSVGTRLRRDAEIAPYLMDVERNLTSGAATYFTSNLFQRLTCFTGSCRLADETGGAKGVFLDCIQAPG